MLAHSWHRTLSVGVIWNFGYGFGLPGRSIRSRMIYFQDPSADGGSGGGAGLEQWSTFTYPMLTPRLFVIEAWHRLTGWVGIGEEQRSSSICSPMDAEIQSLFQHLNGSGSEDDHDAGIRLRKVLGDDLPSHLLARYRLQTQWSPRNAYLHEALRYARRSDDAVSLGKFAIGDKSKAVRHRACMLLACSLRLVLLPFLE